MLSRDCLTKEHEKFMTFIRSKFDLTVESNDIHKWIASLEKDHEVTVITQNIDGLHEKAGSTNIVNYHGNMNKWYCTDHEVCKLEYDLDYAINNSTCSCSEDIRPDVVLYGENIKQECDSKAINAMSEADLIIVVGTSLTVQPFASLLLAADPFAKTVLMNKEETANYSSAFVLKFICDALEVVKELN